MTRPFSPHSRCVKCGSSYASARYMFIGLIRRTCGRCGYTWDELPLDAL